jgi:5'-nucleotidase / UDP-sugar diphosphatase
VPRIASVVVLFALGCSDRTGHGIHGEAELVVLHTADTHSALFPFRERIGWFDATHGLGTEGFVERIGGFARLAHLIEDERARAERALVLDSGDAFQGSLAFDAWGGEAELLGLAALGVQAQALGNHELDRGLPNLRERYRELATFPLLAANYVKDANTGITELASPFVVLDASGLRVAVVGVGNVRSVPELAERPNELGVIAANAASAVQGVVDELRPVVDLVVAVTHVGLDADRALVRATSGLDAVFGGHQHVALDTPRWENDCGGSGEGTVRDAWGYTRRCTSRPVPIVHSGAYGKYLGRLVLVLDDDPAHLASTYDRLDGHEVTSASFALVPAHAGVPEDPRVNEVLEPYRSSALERFFASDVLAFAPAFVPRVGATGGDSPLGNLAAGAARRAADAALAVIGSSSLRRDLVFGPVYAEALERSFPFDDPVLRVRVSGSDLLTAFERAASSAEARECRSPVQVAGALVRFACPCEGPPCARVFAPESEICCTNDADCTKVSGACGPGVGGVSRCFLPVAPGESYELSTTGYLADGGSGLFDPIRDLDRTPVAEGLRELLTEALAESAPCSPPPGDRDDACPRALVEHIEEHAIDDGVAFPPGNAWQRAQALCAVLPCLDESAGAFRDGRIRIERP